jgi:hypothetical protein
MNMRIINIVKIKNNTLDYIVPFPIWEEQTSDDVTFAAERCFLEEVNKELKTYLNSNEEYDHIEDGFYESPTGKFSVYIHHSNIQ